jgi:hypothetical protein
LVLSGSSKEGLVTAKGEFTAILMPIAPQKTGFTNNLYFKDKNWCGSKPL